MSPSDKARKQLVKTLRVYAAAVEGDAESAVNNDGLVIGLKEAAHEIEALADQLDFRVADRLGDEVIEVVKHVLEQESDGYKATVLNPVYIDNNGFSASIMDGQPDGFTWIVTCRREEKDAGAEGTKDPA